MQTERDIPSDSGVMQKLWTTVKESCPQHPMTSSPWNSDLGAGDQTSAINTTGGGAGAQVTRPQLSPPEGLGWRQVSLPSLRASVTDPTLVSICMVFGFCPL